MSTKESKDRCVGEYPALWRFTYTHEVPVRVADDTGDSEFSHMETVHGQFDVMALTPGLAVEAFKINHPATNYALKEGPTFVCYVDAVVSIAKGYGGHFS